MNIIDYNLKYEITEKGNIIGEGQTRVVVEYKGKIYKIALEGWYDENRKEVEIYSQDWYKERYKFLNPVLAHSEDYQVIEIERLQCKEIEYMYEEVEEDNFFIEEFVDVFPKFKKSVDFDFDTLYEFIEDLNLDRFECLEPFQWGINKDGKLRLTDYSR